MSSVACFRHRDDGLIVLDAAVVGGALRDVARDADDADDVFVVEALADQRLGESFFRVREEFRRGRFEAAEFRLEHLAETARAKRALEEDLDGGRIDDEKF